MVNDIEIISAFVGAILAISGAVILNIYTTGIKNKREFLKSQLCYLLLPLHIRFHLIDNEYIDRVTDTYRANTDEAEEEFVKVLIEDEEIKKIVAKNLCLASQDLSRLLLQFLELQYAYDFGLKPSSDSEYMLNHYEKLRKTIDEEYYKKVKLYQKNYWFL